MSDTHGWVVGLGLAQAFVLAGSTEVIAATRPIRDGATAEIIVALYEALGASSMDALDVGRALRQVAARSDLHASTSDVMSFRAVRR
jgi:CHAT domain-containing protein